MTFVPAAVALLVTGKVSEHENYLMRAARRIYAPLLAASIRNRFGVAVIAVLMVVLCGIAASHMGGEFIPSLDELDASAEVVRIPSVSVTQSVAMEAMLEKRLLKLPEVKEVFARTGTAEVATDPMPQSNSDNYIMLKARKEWPDPAKPKAAVVAEIQAAAEDRGGEGPRVDLARSVIRAGRARVVVVVMTPGIRPNCASAPRARRQIPSQRASGLNGELK